MTTRASGTCSSLPSPMPSAIGTSPSMRRDRRHQNRPQPRAAGQLDRLAQRQSVAAPQHVGVVDEQDARC